jgi:hypothetical protein
MAAVDPADAQALAKEAKRDPYVTPRVKQAIRHNIRLLHGNAKEPTASGT